MNGPIEKARADYAKGIKDENLYLAYNDDGEAYRRGWREARIAAERESERKAAETVLAQTSTAPTPETPATPAKQPETSVPATISLAPMEQDEPPFIPDDSKPAPKSEIATEDDPLQMDLLSVDETWKQHWKGMPDFQQNDLTSWQQVIVHFRNREDRNAFGKLTDQKLTNDTRSMWFPKVTIDGYMNKRFVSDEIVNPRFPIYVISKGRAESRLTSKALEKMGVPYRIVVEPQELESYASVIDRAKILVLPFSNLGQGSIPARNWCWQHAVGEGHKRHWMLDDNIRGFFRLYDNFKVPVTNGATFRAAEDWSERFENIALSGFQYFMFAPRKTIIPPLTLNTRIYSCILINHQLAPEPGQVVYETTLPRLPERWRGRYNEDTDLSIRALKAGWCTALFNAFLQDKATTMTMTGGNTEALYKIEVGSKDGRLLMAESLLAQHPDVVKIVEKWGRFQHHVHYRIWRGNKLVPKAGVEIADETNNYGMKFERIAP